MPLLSAATGGFAGTTDGILLTLQPGHPGPGLWSTITDNGDASLTLTLDNYYPHEGELVDHGNGTATITLGV